MKEIVRMPKKAKVHFVLPEFSEQKTGTLDFNIINHSENMAYCRVIGGKGVKNLEIKAICV